MALGTQGGGRGGGHPVPELSSTYHSALSLLFEYFLHELECVFDLLFSSTSCPTAARIK